MAPGARETQEDNYGITRAAPNHDGGSAVEYVGFSSEQIAILFRVKALYQQWAYHEATPEYKRLAFVRWLYEQGRLQS